MSSRRRRRSPPSPSPSPAAAVADDLVSRLRALLPPGPAAAASGGKASTAQVLEETCVYIQRLHAEVDGLAERLAQLLEDPSAGSGHRADDDAA